MTQHVLLLARRARDARRDALRWTLFLGAVLGLLLTTAPIRFG